MIFSKSIRQQHALRAVFSIPKQPLPPHFPQRRHIHKVPTLKYGEVFSVKGVPGLLSNGGFDIAWTQYQGYIVNKLNALTAGTEDENVLTKTILLKRARQAEYASLFNHASMAHNNHLFFTTISPESTPIPEPLLNQINLSFSSLDTFRSTLLATAAAMFGPGFVWLVRRKTPSTPSSPGALSILTTYLAGSPYPGAHHREQPVDMATTTTNIYTNDTPQSYANSKYGGAGGGGLFAGSFGMHSRHDKKLAPGGQDLDVLMGVNTWEHVWLRDYGVSGKRQFLEQWWKRIDWAVVEANMGNLDGRAWQGKR